MISRSSIGAAACALVLLGAGACSSGDGDANDPPGGSSSSPGASQATGSASSSSDAATTESPAVAPASGPVVDFDLGSYHVPAGVDWTMSRRGLSAHGTLETASSVAFVDFATINVKFGGTVDAAAKLSLGQLRDEGRKVKRLADREIAGRTVYVIEGQDDSGYLFVFGTATDTGGVEVTFNADEKSATTDTWLESVLASLVWK